MSTDNILDLWRNALTVAASVAAPFLIAGLVVGLSVAVIQTATQLQESVLTFVPKLAVALAVIALCGHWMLDRLGQFTIAAFTAQAEPAQTDPTHIDPPGPGVERPGFTPGRGIVR